MQSIALYITVIAISIKQYSGFLLLHLTY